MEADFGSRLVLRAPAKVNLSLEVCGKRADGYHDLRMLMAPVSLWDEVILEPLAEEGRLEVACEGVPEVAAGEDNLCHRAARFYREETGQRVGLRIRVRKTIPAGAGLGGGSSDAAATLMGLERLCSRPLDGEARRRAAHRVGADVPFFFARGPAWVEGIGERVTPLPEVPPLWLVLVHPGVFLPTPQVFSRFTMGLTSPGRVHTIAQFNFQGLLQGLRNDLQDAAVTLEPRVGTALEVLGRAGAPGRLMSGSGSAVFGLFADEASARDAADRVQRAPETCGWRIEVVHTLPPGAYPFLDEQHPDWGVDKR